MKVDVTNYKSFEDLSESIKQLNENWKALTANSDRKSSFAGIQREMIHTHLFIMNERKDLLADVEKLKDVYSEKVIAERREKLLAQFDEMVQAVIEATKQDIKALSSSKLEKIGDMLGEAPSEGQLRLLSALQMREDMDAVELHHILPVFFDNYQSMRVLNAISEQNGILLNLPVQLDARTMFDTLNEATDYLLAACNEIAKPWENMNVMYHAFYTHNEEEKDKQYDPTYQRFIDMFDNTPQLQEVKAEKQHLSKGEKARIDWYMREVKGLDASNPSDYMTILKHMNDVAKEHPEMIALFTMSEYKDLVREIKVENPTEE